MMTEADARRLQDPARMLRLAVRQNDETKVNSLLDWLLKKVPLVHAPEEELIYMNVIRGSSTPGDDGLPFETDAANIVRAIRISRAHEVPMLGVGDRIVSVDGKELQMQVRETMEAETVTSIGVWKRAAMTHVRRNLARPALNDALLEVCKSAQEPWASDMARTFLGVGARSVGVRASVTHADSNGMSALHWAAHRGQFDLVEILLNADASIEGTIGAKPPPPAT